MGVKSTRQWPMPAAIWCKTSTCRNTKFACFQHRVNGNWFCLQADGNFRPPPQNPHPLTDHQKIWYRWLFPYGCAKFGANPPIEALGKWVKYNKLKKMFFIPFLGTHWQTKPISGLSRLMAQTTQTCTRVCLLGVSLILLPVLGVKASPQKKNFGGADKCFHAKQAKYWNFHIIESTALISTKFCTMIDVFCN